MKNENVLYDFTEYFYLLLLLIRCQTHIELLTFELFQTNSVAKRNDHTVDVDHSRVYAVLRINENISHQLIIGIFGMCEMALKIRKRFHGKYIFFFFVHSTK